LQRVGKQRGTEYCNFHCDLRQLAVSTNGCGRWLSISRSSSSSSEWVAAAAADGVVSLSMSISAPLDARRLLIDVTSRAAHRRHIRWPTSGTQLLSNTGVDKNVTHMPSASAAAEKWLVGELVSEFC